MRKVCVSDHQGSDRQGDTPLDLYHRQGDWYICIFCLLHLSDVVIAHPKLKFEKFLNAGLLLR